MKKILFVLLAVTLAIAGCRKKSITNNCCSTPPFKATFTGGYILVPNIFTPDNDGKNDTFGPITVGVTNYVMKILTTKEEIYRTTSGQVWDGTESNGNVIRDIVGWEINVATANGENFDYFGQVCVLTEGNSICPKNIERCIFANQYEVSAATLNPEKESGEMLCTE